jgi:Domain of unknown function (DUF4266)
MNHSAIHLSGSLPLRGAKIGFLRGIQVLRAAGVTSASLRKHQRMGGWAALAFTCLAPGCAVVEPYERDHLASYAMRPDRDPLCVRLNEHLWTSREAAEGGGKVGGGGCGCN